LRSVNAFGHFPFAFADTYGNDPDYAGDRQSDTTEAAATRPHPFPRHSNNKIHNDEEGRNLTFVPRAEGPWFVAPQGAYLLLDHGAVGAPAPYMSNMSKHSRLFIAVPQKVTTNGARRG
jgi:hypothetical protein